MIIDTKKLSGPCACGQAHSMATRRAIIEHGCMRQMDALLTEAGLTGAVCAIYDTNTYHAKGLVRPRADQEIVLAAEGLRADDGAVASVLQQLDRSACVLLAVGAGTIHDIVRYCANRLGIPFIACPTAASVDGYSTSHCSMHWRGAQVIMPGVAPLYVVVDLDIIEQASADLAKGGVGDAISKFTALADWKIAALLTGETLCPVAESILRQSAVAAQGACDDLSHGDARAYAQLMYALILAGFAVQMLGNTHPAAGAEHMLCHLMELLPDTYGPQTPVSHGESAGVSTLLIADLYHRLGAIEDIAPYVKPYKPLEKEALTRAFGPSLGVTLLNENTPDCLLAVDRAALVDNWADIRHILAEIPDQQTITAMLTSVGAKVTMQDLGLSGAKVARMLQLAPCVRNQLTLCRIMRMLKYRYSSNADASRAPSRKSRYADKAISRAGKSSAVSVSSMR